MEEKSIYDVNDIILIMKCKKSKASNIILALNNKRVEEGLPRECVVAGKIPVKYFHEKMKI